MKKPAAKPAKPPAAAKATNTAKAKPDPIIARSARELGPLVGRSHTAINGWLKRDDWNFGPGPWTASAVVRIQQWAATELVDRPTTAEIKSPADAGQVGLEGLSIKSRVDVALKMTKREAIAHALDVAKGKYHDVADCRQKKRRQFLAFKAALFALPDEIPTDSDTKTIIRGRIVEAFRRLAHDMGLRRDDLVGDAGATAAGGAGTGVNVVGETTSS